MKVRYIYSACIEIEASDLRILTDPWFTPGIYDGSWHQFPVMDDPLTVIKEPDVIYISHIHPDHYDPTLLRKLFDKYGKKPILIPQLSPNYLELKAKFDGFDVTPTDYVQMKGVDIHIAPNVWGSPSDIDSALFVHHEGQTVLNLNDCIHNPSHSEILKQIIADYTDELDLLALGYTSAGTYPQTYYDIDAQNKELLIAAEAKKQQFFERYKQYCDIFPARNHLPFAGKYILGGSLSKLNAYRGVADATEVLGFDPKAVVLADGGEGSIDLSSDEISKVRVEPYSNEAIYKAESDLSHIQYRYETDISVPFKAINFERLLRGAYTKARRKSQVNDDYHYVIHILEDDETRASFLLNCKEDSFSKLKGGENLPEPRSEIFIDYRYLFGLLSSIYHWNNAEIGSQFQTRRYPIEAHNYAARAFLNFFCAV